MGRKWREQKEEVLQWMVALACVLYVLVVVKWIREGHGHGLHGYRPRRAGGDLGDVVHYSELFWREHYRQAASVSWHLVSEDFIISTAGAGTNLTHGTAALLAPYVDEDADGFVTPDELTAFLNRFGAPTAPGQGPLEAAVGKALQHTETMHGSVAGGGKDDTSGCGLQFTHDKKHHLELVNSGNLQFPGSQAFTIEAWVQPARRNKDLVILSKYNRGKWGQYILKVDPLGYVFFHREVAPWGQKSEQKLPVGDFSHVAAIYDGKMSRIFVNGTLSHEQKEGPQDNNPETPVLIGAMQEHGHPIEFFDGVIDEVRMWDVARTPEDLHKFMHVSLSASEPGLVGLWTFDECMGVKAKDRVGKHDAVLRGATWAKSQLKMKMYQDTFGCVDTLC
eukprot:jgi/Tetstr1/427708/TSEL_017833.t1